MSDPIKATVKIYKKEYTISGEKPRDYIVKISAHVDEVMHTLAKGLVDSSPTDIAVLSALNISDELYTYMEKHEANGKELEQMEKDISHYTQLWEEAKKNFLQYKEDTAKALAEKDKLQERLNEKAIENDNLLKATVAKDEKIADLESRMAGIAQKLKAREESEAISDVQNQKLEDTYKELEGNYLELQMENIQLKGELDRLRKLDG
ncbi:MAG: cell division protein ZapA [Clostridiales Family XIII bacterium]|jgi:cell division protein ZapA|nr:cell division protein ZapA [Clostridiales Family XIII bacterium]